MNHLDQKKALSERIDALMLKAPTGVSRELVGSRLRAGKSEAEAIAPPMSRAQSGRRAARTTGSRRQLDAAFKSGKPTGGARG